MPEFTNDGLATGRPSVWALIFYLMSYRLARPVIRRLVLGCGKRPVSAQLAFLGSRINKIARLQRLLPLRGVHVERGAVDGLSMEIVRPVGGQAALHSGVVLYFHGGGFMMGSLDTHRHVVAAIARLTGLPVMHIEYRQYPDVTVDGSVDDCCRAYQWLLEQGADPARTVLAGDSAGGFLAYATALHAQQRGLPRPAGVVGLSALLELDGTARGAYGSVDDDAFGVSLVLPTIVEHTYPQLGTTKDPSPINGPLNTMPPSLLIAAETEILRCDAERLYGALTRSGRSSVLEIWPKQLHAFPALLPFLPESREAFASVAQFIKSRVDADASALNERDQAV
ncbi:alpha/beta hydrolase [Mycobacteroides salmoniphilum]|uniref:alpha/beta hydrolase n=1 Tax=Mycobacteroides salmoniphilum TaxID=404941 RepID=UPI001F3FDA76|nr:alpha/beta hydrolase [Mycobacteroides salmoniphilum]